VENDNDARKYGDLYPERTQERQKRRLVSAADKLIYEQTFHTTTLADIAKLADVPLGNVYYYFKTKEAILDAVLHKRLKQWQSLFNQWDQIQDTKVRLKALLQHSIEQSETYARFGCMMGTLCQELGKQGGILSDHAAKLMQDLLNWLEKQFHALGKNDMSARLAEYFLSSIQGMSLLTLTFKQPELMNRQSKHLEEWLETL
jgi:TetR/AcrR family transcriptional regulator, transcriptional repressor for nem operon